jgi:hypothetical protein
MFTVNFRNSGNKAGNNPYVKNEDLYKNKGEDRMGNLDFDINALLYKFPKVF